MYPSEPKPLYARTGPLRRRPVEIEVDAIIERIHREGEGCVSFVCIDIDGFSAIEQEHGYAFADQLLDGIAEHLKEAANAAIAARFVRDSFVLVYDGLTLEQAFLKAEEVRGRLSATTFQVPEEDGQAVGVQVAFSAGVSSFPADADNRNQLITLAENAAQQAKEQGGGRITFGRPQSMTPKTSHYSPDQLARLKQLGERLKLPEAELLREALDDLLRKYDQRDHRRRLDY